MWITSDVFCVTMHVASWADSASASCSTVCCKFNHFKTLRLIDGFRLFFCNLSVLSEGELNPVWSLGVSRLE